jgi:tetratricopeptide (TPR) repeat protein
MTRIRPPKRPSIVAAASLAFALLAARLPGASVDGSAAKGPGPGSPVPALSSTRAAEIHGLLNLGASMTERGDYDAANIAFRQVLDDTGAPVADTKTALLGLAHMHRRQGALTKAAAIYEKFLKEYPGDDRSPDALLELGRTLRSMGAYKTAITRFYSVINSTLKLPAEGFTHYQQLAKTAQFEIAETHFQAGEFEEAGKFFSRLSLLDLTPADQAHAHFMSAYAMHLQGDREGSVAMFRAFVKQWPDDENVPEARYLLATNLRALNRKQDAFTETLALLRAEKSQVSANPKRWAYWQRRTGNQLANDFFESGDILNAQAIYASLASLSDDPSWQLPVTYQVALCDERLGAAESARDSYRKIVASTAGQASPALQELGRMAAWRLAQLDWHDNISRQITTLIETSTGRPQTPVRSANPPAP